MPRGNIELDKFVAAMQHELTDNEHKGHWLDIRVLDSVGNVTGIIPATLSDLVPDMLYHAAKLIVALQNDDKQAVREYAADTANCAMFVADYAGALEQPDHDGPIEYDREHAELWRGMDRRDFRRMAEDWFNDVCAAVDARERTDA